MTRVYHQVGFQSSWNKQSLLLDQTGAGLIFAPRYQPKTEVTSTEYWVRARSLFDPQFFIPQVSRGGLSTYDFFPNVVCDDFVSNEYSQQQANQSAEACLRFQREMDFEKTIIPTRFHDGNPQTTISSHNRLFVQPFLQSYSAHSDNKPLLLQLILTERVLKDERNSADFLNWVTSLPIKGCYLIPFLTNRGNEKQITDSQFLVGLLKFIKSLRDNEMEVVVGYLNTEALLLLAAGPTAVATGAYENLRMFHPDNFDHPQPNRVMQGPAARLFISQLLHWIDFRYIGALLEALPSSHSFIDDSPYAATVGDLTTNWHFTNPVIYKHYFSVFFPLLERVGRLPQAERISAIRKLLTEANDIFQEIDNKGVFLDRTNSGFHLGTWITALNQFERQL